MTLMEKGRRLWQSWNPAQFMLRRRVERGSETTEEEIGMQFVRFAGSGLKELDRRIERRNDFERASALFGDLAMHRAQGLLPGFDPAAWKEESQLIDHARYPKLLVEDHYIRGAAPPRIACARAGQRCGRCSSVRRVRYSRGLASQTT